MMLCLAVTCKVPVSETNICETAGNSPGVSAALQRQSPPTAPLLPHSTSGPAVDRRPPSSVQTLGRPLKARSIDG